MEGGSPGLSFQSPPGLIQSTASFPPPPGRREPGPWMGVPLTHWHKGEALHAVAAAHTWTPLGGFGPSDDGSATDPTWFLCLANGSHSLCDSWYLWEAEELVSSRGFCEGLRVFHVTRPSCSLFPPRGPLLSLGLKLGPQNPDLHKPRPVTSVSPGLTLSE